MPVLAGHGAEELGGERVRVGWHLGRVDGNRVQWLWRDAGLLLVVDIVQVVAASSRVQSTRAGQLGCARQAQTSLLSTQVLLAQHAQLFLTLGEHAQTFAVLFS